jgi:hypothetical protein
VDGPVGTADLAELAGAIEGVDDPEAPGSRDVLETLLRTHVVVWIEPVDLLDQQLVGQTIAGRPEVPAGWWPGAELQERLASHGGQRGCVMVLGGQILLLDGGHVTPSGSWSLMSSRDGDVVGTGPSR